MIQMSVLVVLTFDTVIISDEPYAAAPSNCMSFEPDCNLCKHDVYDRLEMSHGMFRF